MLNVYNYQKLQLKAFEAFVVVEPYILLGKWLIKAFVTK